MLQIPWRFNLVLALGVLGIYIAFFFGAALVAEHRFVLFTSVSVLFVIVTPTLWGLVHEGIHGRLVTPPVANRLASRALCVLLGFSFDAVQFGHLMHHRYNGHEHDRPNRMKPGEPSWMSWSRHCVHLFGGHYAFAALVGAVAFAPPRLRELAVRNALCSEESDIVAMQRAALKLRNGWPRQ